ncbi:MAG: acetyl-CoA C-acetyltransferase [Acidobacteriota bacterium]
MKEGLVLVGGARTPMAEYNGHLSHLSAVDLGVHAAKAALERSGVRPDQVDHVVFGNVLQAGNDAIYLTRHIGLKAGLPVEVPALTVNRLCGSGFQALVSGAHQILLGEASVVLCGGTESMSNAPYVVRGARQGLRLGHVPFVDTLMESLRDPYCDLPMAVTAENLAQRYGITREEQDLLALRSQRRAEEAFRAGRFREEIAPILLEDRKKGSYAFAEDTHRKPETTLEALSRLRPAFRKDGTVTGGNASGIVDGAAALVLAREDKARAEGWPILGYLRGWSYAGVPPEIMGFGPVPAIRKILEAEGLSLSDVGLFEVNEAFAAQYLACEKELGLDPEKTNVNGGAVALGHPLGTTGTRLTLTLLLEMRRRKTRFGIASACIGGGQGMAVLLETGPAAP